MIDDLSIVNGLFFIVLGGFLLDWLAVAYEWLRIKPITKILAMGLVILWTIYTSERGAYITLILLLLAQLFGLLGDIYLLLRQKWFLWGLGAFLVGHVFYLVLFLLQLAEAIRYVELTSLRILVGCAILMGWVFFLFWFYRLVRKLNSRQLSLGVSIYGGVLSSIVAISFSLVLFSTNLQGIYTLLSAGALLFLISDSLLAYNRFVKRIPRGQLWVRITYHLAQFCLAAGFVILIN
jgi:uncharacterized membrane protein YhhN